MKSGCLEWLPAACLAALMLSEAAGALDVFRVGGEGEPRPTQGTFHPLSWRDLTQAEGLDAVVY